MHAPPKRVQSSCHRYPRHEGTGPSRTGSPKRIAQEAVARKRPLDFVDPSLWPAAWITHKIEPWVVFSPKNAASAVNATNLVLREIASQLFFIIRY
jgi:hypothetical protein